jgi:hypothetical protein
LELAVGIVGHRLNKIPAAARTRIEQQLSSIFAQIDELAGREFARHPTVAGACGVRLVSNLAEGTDQIAIMLRPKGWAVDAILPFPRERYLMDFAPAHASGGIDRRPEFEAALAQADSLVELPAQDDVLLGYERAGELLLQRCKVLVAVWDGAPRVGRGGTEAVIAAARAAERPVIWIHATRDQVPMVLAASEATAQPVTTEALAHIVATALGAPRS